MAKQKKRNGGIWAVVILVILIVVLAATCPSREDHKNVLERDLAEYLAPGYGQATANALNLISTVFGNGIIDNVLDKVYTTKSYLVCSVGTVKCLDGKNKMVSLGILNHVYTFNLDDLPEDVLGLDD